MESLWLTDQGWWLLVDLSEDSQNPMNIHPCSNLLARYVPILNQSEKLKVVKYKFPPYVLYISLFLGMNYFNPRMLVFYIAKAYLYSWFFVSESPFMETWSLAGNSATSPWKMDLWLAMRKGIPSISRPVTLWTRISRSLFYFQAGEIQSQKAIITLDQRLQLLNYHNELMQCTVV